MAKYDAYGTQLKIGTAQVETALVVAANVTAGTANFTLTAAGMTGSPITTVVTLANGDSAEIVARKAVDAMNLNGNITALFNIVANGPYIVITRKVAAPNDSALNLAYANGTCTGLVEDATSNDTVAGVGLATIAQVQSISGPGLSLDTEDVTTHDSAGAFEEVVGTVIRSGEITLEIVYDPAEDTHDATSGNGLLARMKNQTLTKFSLVFPDAAETTWAFDGYVIGFEPSAAHDGALTASVTIKVTGNMTLT